MLGGVAGLRFEIWGRKIKEDALWGHFPRCQPWKALPPHPYNPFNLRTTEAQLKGPGDSQ